MPRADAPRSALAYALIAAALLCPGSARATLTVPTDFVDEEVFHGLNQSVAIAMLPDARIFVVEKETARVRLIVNGALAATDPVITVPDVDSDILEEGLLGVAVDPSWPTWPYLYVYYNYAGSDNIRLSRYTVGGDLAFTGDGNLTIDPGTRYDILTDIPDLSPFHNAGTLRFGPDGMLYVSIGDDYNPCQSQDIEVLAGKVLRLDVSLLPQGGGGPPPKSIITPFDNPFVGNPNANARLVIHRGLRNPFRFAIDALTGDIAIGDAGADDREEIDHLTALGGNLQWPIYEGDIPGPTTCAWVDSSSWNAPVHVYDHNQGAAVVAGVIYRPPAGASDPFPSYYDGDIFFTDFYGGWVRRLKHTGDTWAPESAYGQPNPTDWATDLGASLITDWAIGPDGSVYYCRLLSMFTQGPGEIRRIRFTGVVSAPSPGRDGLEFRAPYPSPSRGPVTFDFALPAAGRVTLDVFDVTGRRVRRLLDPGERAAGTHRARWDGRDDAGRRAAPGVYLARLTAAGRVLERRLALLD